MLLNVVIFNGKVKQQAYIITMKNLTLLKHAINMKQGFKTACLDPTADQ
jgi:hypothetical protein